MEAERLCKLRDCTPCSRHMPALLLSPVGRPRSPIPVNATDIMFIASGCKPSHTTMENNVVALQFKD